PWGRPAVAHPPAAKRSSSRPPAKPMPHTNLTTNPKADYHDRSSTTSGNGCGIAEAGDLSWNRWSSGCMILREGMRKHKTTRDGKLCIFGLERNLKSLIGARLAKPFS